MFNNYMIENAPVIIQLGDTTFEVQRHSACSTFVKARKLVMTPGRGSRVHLVGVSHMKTYTRDERDAAAQFAKTLAEAAGLR